MAKTQYVVPRDDGWAVRSEGKTKDTKQFNTQREAIEYAREIAKNYATELIIHGRDGRIRERISYGHDPAGVEPGHVPTLRKNTVKQHPSAEQSLQSMLDVYHKRAAETDPLEAFLGMFDDDVTDMSTTVRETMEDYYQKKYGDST